MDGDDRPRRRLSAAAKARLVAQALTPGVHVATLARRHGVSTSSLYAWCRTARRADDDGGGNRLVPVVIDDAGLPPVQSAPSAGEIEIALAGAVRIVVRGAVETDRLRAVLAALR